MPQMAPLFWLNLFIFFFIVFMVFLISNFFIKTPIKISLSEKPTKITKLNWKW